ncbi:DUF3592 domain-containing protein [bacterium]|nr:DUF3592 domain-containing protein [bacterium]
MRTRVRSRGGMWFIWIFPIVGLGLLVGAGFMVWNTVKFLQRGVPGVAQVVGYTASSDSDGGTTWAPQLRLIEPPLGLEQTSDVSSSERKWKIGTKLKVKFDPEKPADFRINSPDDILMGPAIMGVIGAVFLIMGLVFVFLFNGPRDEVIWEPEQDLQAEQLERVG